MVNIDESDFSSSYQLTTDNLEAATFTEGGQIDADNDFGYNIVSQKVLITGTVWEDRDADTEIDAIEDGRADNITVNLYNDANADGILDDAENTPVAITTTDAQGTYEFERDLLTSESFATSVEYQSGITNSTSAIGDPSTTFAEFYEDSDNLILELENETASSDEYSFFLANKTAGQNAEVIISESTDGINFTYNTTITVTSDSKDEYTIKAGQNTKFVKIDKGSINSISGYNVNGSASGSMNDFKVFGVENTGAANNNYIIKIDETTFSDPSRTILTTDNYEYAAFTGSGSDINNDFGYQNTAALPVSWGTFTVRNGERFIALEWSTVTEVNNELFEIERSIDGFNFTTVDIVMSDAIGGMSYTVLNYSYADYSAPKNQFLYYRIKQVDYDGKFEYSTIRTVEPNSNEATISVFPNPATHQVNVQTDYVYPVAIYSANGQLVKEGQTNQTIVTSDLKSGSYIILINNGSAQIRHKLNIQE